MTQLHHILLSALLTAEVVAITTGLLRFRQLTGSMRLLFFLCLFGLSTDLLMRLLAQIKVSNLFLITLYVPAEFLLLSAIYKMELKQKQIRRVIPVLVVALSAYSLWNGIADRGHRFYPLERLAEGLCVVGYAICYFYETLRDLHFRHLERTPLFWLSAGLFIYFACDMIIFIVSNFILAGYSKEFNYEIWHAHMLFTILLYLFYTLALWISPKS